MPEILVFNEDAKQNQQKLLFFLKEMCLHLEPNDKTHIPESPEMCVCNHL